MTTPQLERRTLPFADTVLRAEEMDDGRRVIRGYTARFEQLSVDLGGFVERIAPGAFSELLQTGPDVRALYNHNPDHILGRTTADTLRLREDSRGLYMEAFPPDSELGRSVHESIRRRDITGQSFAFSDVDDEWDEQFTVRTIKRVGALYDVGPVTYPAYPDTSVAVRSRKIAQETRCVTVPVNITFDDQGKAHFPNGSTVTVASIGSGYTIVDSTTPTYRSQPADEPAQDSQEADPQREWSDSSPPNKTGESRTMTPRDIREKAQRLLDAAQGIRNDAETEGRSLTSEELNDINAKLDQRKDLIAEAETLEALEGADEETKVAKRQVPADVHKKDVQTVQQRNQANPQTTRIYTPTRANLRAFKRDLFGGSVVNANEAAYRSGMWLGATLLNSEKCREYCRLNGIDIDTRAQQSNINTKGGYLIPDELESAVINVMDEFGAARQVCRIHRMAGDTLRVPVRKSGLSAYFINEASDFTESDKDWDNAELVAKKLGVIVKYTSEVAEDAIIDMADDLAEEIGVAMADTEDDCFLNGDGTSTYGGIEGIWYLLENDEWSASLLDAASGHDTLAEVDHDDLALLYGNLPKKYQRDAAWMCHPLTKAAVFDALLQGAGGNQNAQLAAGQPASYMGYPIITSEKFYSPATPSTAANDKVPIIFGSFRNGCSFGDRRQITVAVSDQRYFESDQLAIRGIERFDIANHNGKPDNANSKIGAVVGLALTT